MASHAYQHAGAVARQLVAGPTESAIAYALDMAYREGRSAAVEACRAGVAADYDAADAATNQSDRNRLRARGNVLSEALTATRARMTLNDPEVASG